MSRSALFIAMLTTLVVAACQTRQPVGKTAGTAFEPFDPCPAVTDSSALVPHSHYTLLYSEPDEQPLWVAYMLTRQRANGKLPRSNNFEPDPAVPTGSAQPADYRRSGYTRGHLVPAGDMKWDSAAMAETFLMSNMSPQLADFNDGVWNRLEGQMRRWARLYDTVYIVTGPVLTGGESEHIGRNRVTVPQAFYKAVYVPSLGQAIAFIVPHSASNAALQTFAVSVDELETALGLDLFPSLPDSVEEQIEGTLCTHCFRW